MSEIQSRSLLQRWITIISLIIAGEAIFALPYHLTRFFRPTVLDVFDLTATQLGVAQGAYGVIAMIAYFFGGPLADRFPAHKLIAWSLWATAIGGIYLSTFPGYYGVMFIWGFFGFTTIFLFWAALIKATRAWGGINQQGQAYGLLDGGRGLLAAVLASVGVWIFATTFPDGYSTASTVEKREVLKLVIYGYTIVTAFTGFLAWYALRNLQDKPDRARANLFENFWQVFRIRAVWLQTVVIVCAYTSFKAFDQFGLFAVRGHGIDEIDAAQIVAIGAWTRPIAALLIGLLGDRFGITRMTFICFLLLIASHGWFALTGATFGTLTIILMNTLVTCIAIYGLRGLYFAMFQEGQVPLALTGTAVGIVSVLGYTPDIYFAAVAGFLIDSNPGLLGFQHMFMLLVAFTILGALAALIFERTCRSATLRNRNTT